MFRKAAHIILDVAIDRDLSMAEVLGRKQSKSLVAARRAAIKKVRKQTALSTTEMGRLFGYKDHTAILHHLKH